MRVQKSYLPVQAGEASNLNGFLPCFLLSLET